MRNLGLTLALGPVFRLPRSTLGSTLVRPKPSRAYLKGAPVVSRPVAACRSIPSQLRLAGLIPAVLLLFPVQGWAADASAAIVADLTSGQVLFSQASEVPRFPASLPTFRASSFTSKR